MKTLEINLNKLSEEKSLRQDFDFLLLRQGAEGDSYSFNDLFKIVESPKVKLDDLDDNFLYCEIGDVDKNGLAIAQILNKQERTLLNENYFSKIENGDIISVEKDQILLSKVRPNLKKYVRITDSNSNFYFTSAFIKLKAKKLPIVLYYCLREQFYSAIMAISRQGKGYPTINEKDLPYLKFNKFLIDALDAKQAEINYKILHIEKEIDGLNRQITPIQNIIDFNLGKEFGFDYSKFDELRKIPNYNSMFGNFANNPDLRFSVKFHRPAGEFVQQELNRITKKKIKNLLAEPILLGASIKPDDFDEFGDAYYVSMASIKNQIVEYDDSQLVSTCYRAKNAEKTLQKGDLIMARSGVAIGKIALVEEDVNSIFADFTMRIRLTNYNVKFAYYYMRSTYFQYLIETYKKGLQNQNIFPIVIKEFPIPDISLEEQQRIVDEIQEEIDKQTSIKQQISSLRGEIDKIIEKAISISGA